MSWALILTHWRAAVWAALAAAAALAFGLWRAQIGETARLRGELAVAQGQSAMAQAQAKASGAASAVVAAGAAREGQTLAQHTENQHDIQAAPGADQALDPGLNDAGRRGLCAYRAYRDDPQCVQLLGADPADLSDTGGPDAAAGN